MKPVPLPERAYLHECFDYNPETGELRWRRRPLHHFRSERGQHMQWTRDAGKLAGTPNNSGGGFEVGAGSGSRKFLAHRIIWKMVTGNDPKNEIDHENNDPLDNRWANLREATRAENNRNTGTKRFKNKPETAHLPKGAYPRLNVHRGEPEYISVITHNGVRHYLGTYRTPEEAHQAYAKASAHLHGKFANPGKH